MARGIPVVTTGEGVEGLNATDGIQAGIADDDAGLILRTVELLGNSELRNRRRRAAREMLAVNCDPIAAARSLERIYERMTHEVSRH
jgi:predicted O-linked N-acetylglucosamine transferase (SPINDLY family)